MRRLWSAEIGSSVTVISTGCRTRLRQSWKGLASGPATMSVFRRRGIFTGSLRSLVSWKLGAAYVPLPEYFPEDRLKGIVEDCGIKVVLGDVPTIADVVDEIVPFDAIAEDAGQSVSAASGEATSDSVAYVMFTSGSTGVPKGAVIPHKAILRLVRGQNFMDLGPNERILQNSPIAFDAATLEIWGALLNGGALIVPEQPTLRLDELGDIIARQNITSTWITAGLFHVMADEQPEALKPLRQLLTGGDVVSPVKVAAVREVCPDLTVINGYGPTENTTFTCCHTITAEDLATGGSLPIGTPINGTDVFIVDDKLMPVAPGRRGRALCGRSWGCLGLSQPARSDGGEIRNGALGRIGDTLSDRGSGQRG